VEVFWLTGHTSWAQISIPIDIDQSDEDVMADVDRAFAVSRKVELGKPATPETQAAIRELGAAVVSSR